LAVTARSARVGSTTPSANDTATRVDDIPAFGEHLDAAPWRRVPRWTRGPAVAD